MLSPQAWSQIALTGDPVRELRAQALARYASETGGFDGIARAAGEVTSTPASGPYGPQFRSVDVFTGLQPSGNFFWRYTASNGGGIPFWALDDGKMGAVGAAAGGAHVLQYEFAYGQYSVSNQDSIRPAILVSFYNAPSDPVNQAVTPVIQESAAASSVLWVFDAPVLPASPAFAQVRTGLLDLSSRGLSFALDDTYYFEILPMNWPDYPNGQPVISNRLHAIFTGPSSLTYGQNADFMWSDVGVRSEVCSGPFASNLNGLYEHPQELDSCHFSPFLNRSPMRIQGDPCDSPNTLRIQASPAAACVRPGDPVVVTVSQSCLPGLMRSYQSFLQFDNTRLTLASADYATPGPYSHLLVSPIVASGSDIDLSAEIDESAGQQPSTSSAILATLTFTAGTIDGFAQIAFRPSDPPTCFSDHVGMTVLPALVDSPVICIDGTPPQISAPPDFDWTCAQPLPAPASDFLEFATQGGSAEDLSICYGPMSPTVVFLNDMVVGGTGCVGDPKLVARTYRAIDCAGNFTDAIQTIRCFDTLPPTVTAAADFSVSSSAGACAAQVAWSAANASDDCAGDLSAFVYYDIDLNNDLSIDATISATTFFLPYGTHRVIAIASDLCGQTANDDFLITVTLQDCSGDLSGDGLVDLLDLTLMLSAYGVSAGGDMDCDGDTDLDDLSAMLSRFGAACP